ncbi:MAG: hypothetical protein QXV73_05190 [Candidatus Micrarchaeia archaeon]
MNHIEEYEYALECEDYYKALRIAFNNARRKSSRSGRSFWLAEVKNCFLKLGIDKSQYDDKVRFADKYGNFAPLEKFIDSL